MSVAEFRSQALTLLVGGAGIFSVIFLIIRSWTWSPMKAKQRPRPEPPVDTADPALSGLAISLTYLAFLGMIAAHHISEASRSAPFEMYVDSTLASGFFLYCFRRQLRLWRVASLLMAGAALLGAVNLLFVYAREWLTTTDHILVALPIIALSAWPAGIFPVRWPRTLVGVFATTVLGWLAFDLAGAVYVLCMWTIPPAVRWSIQYAKRRSS